MQRNYIQMEEEKDYLLNTKTGDRKRQFASWIYQQQKMSNPSLGFNVE